MNVPLRQVGVIEEEEMEDSFEDNNSTSLDNKNLQDLTPLNPLKFNSEGLAMNTEENMEFELANENELDDDTEESKERIS